MVVSSRFCTVRRGAEIHDEHSTLVSIAFLSAVPRLFSAGDLRETNSGPGGSARFIRHQGRGCLLQWVGSRSGGATSTDSLMILLQSPHLHLTPLQ